MSDNQAEQNLFTPNIYAEISDIIDVGGKSQNSSTSSLPSTKYAIPPMRPIDTRIQQDNATHEPSPLTSALKSNEFQPQLLATKLSQRQQHIESIVKNLTNEIRETAEKVKAFDTYADTTATSTSIISEISSAEAKDHTRGLNSRDTISEGFDQGPINVKLVEEIAKLRAQMRGWEHQKSSHDVNNENLVHGSARTEDFGRQSTSVHASDWPSKRPISTYQMASESIMLDEKSMDLPKMARLSTLTHDLQEMTNSYELLADQHSQLQAQYNDLHSTYTSHRQKCELTLEKNRILLGNAQDQNQVLQQYADTILDLQARVTEVEEQKQLVERTLTSERKSHDSINATHLKHIQYLKSCIASLSGDTNYADTTAEDLDADQGSDEQERIRNQTPYPSFHKQKDEKNPNEDKSYRQSGQKDHQSIPSLKATIQYYKDTYETDTAVYQKKIKQLLHDISQVQDNFDRYKRDNPSQDEYLSIKAKLSIQQDLVLQHLTELETKNTIIESLQDRLNVESSNAELTRSQLVHTKDQIKSLKSTSSRTLADFKALKTTHESILAINNALDLKVKTISGVSVSRQLLIGDLKAKITTLEASVSTLSGTKKNHDDLRDQIKKMRGDALLKEDLIAGMKRKLDTLKAELAPIMPKKDQSSLRSVAAEPPRVAEFRNLKARNTLYLSKLTQIHAALTRLVQSVKSLSLQRANSGIPSNQKGILKPVAAGLVSAVDQPTPESVLSKARGISRLYFGLDLEEVVGGIGDNVDALNGILEMDTFEEELYRFLRSLISVK